MPLTDRDLLTLSADVCYTYNARGRMLLTNEPYVPDRQPAPHLYLGRTVTGFIVRFGARESEDLVRQVEERLAVLSPDAFSDASPDALAVPVLQEVLATHPATLTEEGGPNYRFPETVQDTGNALRLTTANRELVRESFPWAYDQLAALQHDLGQPRLTGRCAARRAGKVWRPCDLDVAGTAGPSSRCAAAGSGAPPDQTWPAPTSV